MQPGVRTGGDETSKALIGRPRGLLLTVGGLKGVTGLSKVEFTALCEVSRRIARQKLDTVRRYSEQDPKALVHVQQKIIQKCPFIKRYQDGWPVREYLSIWLAGCQTNPKNRALRREAGLGISGLADKGNSHAHPSMAKVIVHAGLSTPRKPRRPFVSRSPIRRELRKGPAGNASTVSGTSSGACQAAVPSLPSLFAKNAGRDPGVPQAVPPSLASKAFSVAHSIGVTDDTTAPVLSFLEQLKMPIPHLFLLFMIEGINSTKALRGLAELGAERQWRWLESLITSGKLSRLAPESIQDGLMELANVHGHK